MASSLQTLKRRKKWPEALALASQTAPQEVPYLLEQAGNTFLKLSQSEKLYNLLETLPKEIKEDSYVLFWRFRIARRLDKHEALLKEVKQALSKNACAELRAFYYTHFDSKEKQLIETKKAMHAKPNFFTKHHYGLALTHVDAEAGQLFFKDFIAEVRQSKEAYWLIQILDIWSFALRKTGRLTQALNCIKEALQLHKNELQSDWVSELHLRNNLIYASIELGKIEGLDDIVYEAEQDIDDIYEQLAFDLRATLGDYYFVKGQLDKAFTYFEKNYHTEQQRHSEVSAESTFNYVKIHLAKNKKESAQEIAKQSLAKTKLQAENKLHNVAYALTVIQTKPKEVLKKLPLLELKQLPDMLQLSARALLAYAYLKQGDRASASQVLKEQTLGELSRQSFQLATVYEELAFIYDFWKGNDLLPIIRNPKAFDDLAKNQDDWNRLALLEHHEGPLEQIRYAQYLITKNESSKALRISKKAFTAWPTALSQAVLMTALLSTGQAEELALYSDTYETKDALDAEGKMRIYEALAGYHYLHLNQPRQAQRYLYWEEALAKEYGLERRIHVVHMLLEEIATALGEVPTLEVLKQEGLAQTQEKQLRQRYDSILSTSNEAAAQALYEQKQLSLAELKLVRALTNYNTALEGKAKFTVALRLIENDIPEQSEASFYWALLMLQLKSKIGSLNHPSETRFLLQTLKESTTSQQNIQFSLPVAARLFPLGLSIAAYVIKELQAGLKFVAIIWDEQEKDGIRQAGKKLSSLSARVRQAIIQDGLNANNKEYQSIISSKTGHTMNKKRFEESLEKANLNKHEVTDIGSIARALHLLSQHNTNAEKSLEKLQEESTYLKKTVPIL